MTGVRWSYRFLTTWLLDSPIEPVWEAINDAAGWPSWWPGVERVVRLEEGDEDGVGALWDQTWRSVLPYPVRFRARVVAVDRPHLIEAAADGELVGTGTWRLYEARGTAVTYDWRVRTSRPWMNALAPVGRPVFRWNHDWIMRRGGEGLARRLGTRLLAAS